MTGLGAQIVGNNNLADVYFDEIDGKQHIVQGVWWQSNDKDETTLKERTYYTVLFEPQGITVGRKKS